jgi:hypothetical protein
MVRMRCIAAALLIAGLVTGCGASSMTPTLPANQAAHQYTASTVLHAYTRAGLRLGSEGYHPFGGASLALYLTLNPSVAVSKKGGSFRGADFSVLLFASASKAQASLTNGARAQLRDAGEPWVTRGNLLLVARTYTSGSSETWKAAKQVLARLR